MDGWRHPAVTQGDLPPFFTVARQKAPPKYQLRRLASRGVVRRLSTFHALFLRIEPIFAFVTKVGVESMIPQMGDQELANLFERERHTNQKVPSAHPCPRSPHPYFHVYREGDASLQDRRTDGRDRQQVYVGSWLQSTNGRGHRGP